MLYRHTATGEVRDLVEDHSATLAWVASGKWEPVNADVEEAGAEIVETPEAPKRRGRRAAAPRPETR